MCYRLRKIALGQRREMTVELCGGYESKSFLRSGIQEPVMT